MVGRQNPGQDLCLGPALDELDVPIQCIILNSSQLWLSVDYHIASISSRMCCEAKCMQVSQPCAALGQTALRLGNSITQTRQNMS